MPNMKVYRSKIAHNLVTMDDYCLHHGIKPLKSVVFPDKEGRKKSLKSR